MQPNQFRYFRIAMVVIALGFAPKSLWEASPTPIGRCETQCAVAGIA
jgi:hypothetical protein